MNKKEKDRIKESRPSGIMSEEEWAKVQGMTYSESLRTPTSRYGIISHYDLDGALSAYFSKKTYPECKIILAQGYAKVHKNCISMYDLGVTHLVMIDLSPTPKTLEYCLSHFENVYLVDHHQESEKYKELAKISPRFQIEYSDKVCGAVLSAKLTPNKINDRERRLLQICNIFDLWKEDSKSEDWDLAHSLNDLFWHYGFDDFVDLLEILDVDNFTKEQNDVIINSKKKREDSIKYGVSQMFETGSIVTLLSNNTGTNYVSELIDYTQFDGTKTGIFYNVYSYDGLRYNCSVRLDRDVDINVGGLVVSLPEKYPDMVGTSGGHEKAAGITFVEKDIEKIIEFIETIVDGVILNAEEG